MNNLKHKLASFVKGRGFSSGVVTAIVIAIFAVANVLMYTVYFAFMVESSSVEKEDLSITGAADLMFNRAQQSGKKVTVTFCMSESDIQTHETGNYVYRTAMEFAERYPDFIEIRYANVMTLKYDDTGEDFNPARYQKVARKDASGEAITDKNGEIIYDEYSLTRASVLFECHTTDTHGTVTRENIKVLTTSSAYSSFFTFDDSGYITSYNGEEIFASNISWVIADEHDTVYFTMGHGEAPSLNFYNALVSAGYYVEEINLRKQSVPDDAAFVVIADPKSDFEKSSEGSGIVSEMDRLKEYAERGGKFYVNMDPIAEALPRLEEFIADFGISFDTAEGGERQLVKDLDKAIGTDGFTLITEYADTPLAKDVYENISDLDGSVIIRDIAALKCDSSKGAASLLVASPSAVLEASGSTTDTDGSYTVVAYSKKYNDTAEAARLVLVPSIYMTASDAMVTNGYSNKDFLYSLFESFYGAENVLYGTNDVVQQSTMLENLTLGTSITYTALLLALPAALAAFGAVTIVRRKNR